MTKKTVFPYIIIALSAFFLLNNMFYSFCWSDEGFYLSTVQRLFIGEKLFVDDWSPTQSYSALILPFYSLFVKINGNTEGIYLFFRVLTVTFQAITAIFLYFVLSKRGRRLEALTGALIALFFSRASLNGPSYYVLGCQFFLLGILFAYCVFELNYSKVLLFISGIFWGLCILCNPYLVLPYIFLSFLVLIFKFLRKKILLFFILWCGTVFVGAMYLLAMFKNMNMDDFFKSLYYVFNDPAYGKSTILFIKRLIKCPRLITFPFILTYLPMIIACVKVKKHKIELTEKNKIILLGLNFFLFVVNTVAFYDCGSAVMSFFHFVLYTAILFLNLGTDNCLESLKRNIYLHILQNFWKKYCKQIVYFIVPGLILAYFFCFASDTGFGVCCIGMSVIAIGILPIYVDAFENAFDVISHKKTLYAFLKFLPLVFVVLATFYFRVNLSYRDTKLRPHYVFIPKLHSEISKITEGPAKGLYTGTIFKQQYDRVLQDIRYVENDCFSSTNKTLSTVPKDDTTKLSTIQKSLFISKLVPWGYIVNANMKIASPTTWRLPFSDFRLKAYFEEFENHKLPDYVLLINEDIRDNDKNKTENTWMQEILTKNYSKEVLSASTLYIKK